MTSSENDDSFVLGDPSFIRIIFSNFELLILTRVNIRSDHAYKSTRSYKHLIGVTSKYGGSIINRYTSHSSDFPDLSWLELCSAL